MHANVVPLDRTALNFDPAHIICGAELYESFLGYNRTEHEKYVAGRTDRDLARRLWEMECLVLKCMDGRLDLTRWTNLPYGLVQSLRTPGGVFEPGHSLLRDRIMGLISYASRVKGRYLLLVVAYHYSQSGSHLGCRFKDGEREGVRQFARGLTESLADIYGRSRSVYPICIGMETDQEALIFEGVGKNERAFSVAEAGLFERVTAMTRLGELYPAMSSKMIENLTEMAFNNSRHVATVCRSKRTEEHLAHNEYGMLLGEGADFHHLPNDLLIVAPVLNDLEVPVNTAVDINCKNFERRHHVMQEKGGGGRVRGILVIGSAYFREDGYDRRSANAQALSHLDYQLAVFRKHRPDMLPYVTGIAGAVDFRTREFHLIRSCSSDAGK